jgi:hypothetical protein
LGDRVLTIEQAKKRTEAFLVGQMVEALRAVDYQVPSFDAKPRDVELSDMARAGVEIRHVRGASDATYLVTSFDDELLMQLQLNVHRLVVVYRVPALDALDAATLAVRLDRWRIGAEHAGGSSAGATRRSQAPLAGTMSRLIATHSPVRIFSKTSSSSSIGAPTSSR